MILKDLMDDLEVGNRVMEEIERINTERKPVRNSNLIGNNLITNTSISFPTSYTQLVAPQQMQQAQLQNNPIYYYGGTNGTI